MANVRKLIAAAALLPALGLAQVRTPDGILPPGRARAHASCDSCHLTHAPEGPGSKGPASGGSDWLLKEKDVTRTCLACHSGGTGTVQEQAQREWAPSLQAAEAAPSSHPGVQANDPRSAAFQRVVVRKGGRKTLLSADCSGCHDTHRSPEGGALGKTVAFDAQGNALDSKPVGDYEVCFGCHGFKSGFGKGGRATAVVFGTVALSAHPVGSYGKTYPSISLIPGAAKNMTCGSCHGDSSGLTKGPHFSGEPHLLLRHDEDRDGTPESPLVYDLCYGCHSRESILADLSFPFHSLHVLGRSTAATASPETPETTPWAAPRFPATPPFGRPPLPAPRGIPRRAIPKPHGSTGTQIPTPCGTCHDPHGSLDGLHLISFDRKLVSPASDGQLYYRSFGGGRGQCSLSCHGADHVGQKYGF